MESRLAEQAREAEAGGRSAERAEASPVGTKKTEVLTKHIGEAAKKDPTVMAQVLRSWLNE